jgi:hypothetical protein
LFLGEVYRYLHLMSLSLLTQKKLRTSGPWWFIQLWAHLYFQDFIPDFPVLADNSFPDQSGRRIRCTSFGQALYSLPGSKLNPSQVSSWFRIFYRGLNNPIFLPYTDSEIFENRSPSDWLILPMMTALGIYILSWSALASFQSAWAPPTGSSSQDMNSISRS